MNTKIKQAHWEAFDKINITTSIFQQEDCIIETFSDFLFEIITSNFFTKFKDQEFNIKFSSAEGVFIAESYRLMVYNLMFEYLFENNNSEPIIDPYNARLFRFDSQFIAKQLTLINYLKIDFKKEEEYFHRLLFNKKDKNNFYISDYHDKKEVDKYIENLKFKNLFQ